ncbi:Polygalacturonase QRT3 [Glycine soja]|uniref:Polygalacturonase QRT3 n=1 Tax=Glycine soja TaxID=3848 RepID=A0A0B2SM61_GLYSO|nr:Polygalacturonase QRT3 [Glycine soja]
MACSIVIGSYEESLPPRTFSSNNYHEAIPRLQSFKASLTRHDSIASAPSSLSPFSTPSYARAPSPLSLQGVNHISLEGGSYLISRSLKLLVAGVGNLMSNGRNSLPSYNFEFITLKDLLLDSNYRGGGISVINSLRTSIDNCYITHFTTNGILVQSGHETYIRNSFLGRHIIAGEDKNERDFSGTGISLQGNDNAVTDVAILSAAIGLMVTGEANAFSAVHCYNKATGFGGTGIYLKLPGLSSFFLGDANIAPKSKNGVVNGVDIVDKNIARGMKLTATVAKMSMQGNGTSWSVDFNNVLLFPNLIKNVQYSLSSKGSSFPNALRNVSENRVVIETNEAVVAANVFVTVDQSALS